jgi:hypothetical protein
MLKKGLRHQSAVTQVKLWRNLHMYLQENILLPPVHIYLNTCDHYVATLIG